MVVVGTGVATPEGSAELSARRAGAGRGVVASRGGPGGGGRPGDRSGRDGGREGAWLAARSSRLAGRRLAPRGRAADCWNLGGPGRARRGGERRTPASLSSRVSGDSSFPVARPSWRGLGPADGGRGNSGRGWWDATPHPLSPQTSSDFGRPGLRSPPLSKKARAADGFSPGKAEIRSRRRRPGLAPRGGRAALGEGPDAVLLSGSRLTARIFFSSVEPGTERCGLRLSAPTRETFSPEPAGVPFGAFSNRTRTAARKGAQASGGPRSGLARCSHLRPLVGDFVQSWPKHSRPHCCFPGCLRPASRDQSVGSAFVTFSFGPCSLPAL